MGWKKLLSVAFITAFSAQLFFGVSSYAANPADFNPGRIIDDEVFYNKDSMSLGDIQAFLNAHVPSCDTWGTRASGYGGLSNAQYAQQIMHWPGPPYVCLNNYYENPDTGATSFENGGGAFSGGISAARIIYNAAQQYRINPKVLLVTLRKESLNLFSDSWPMKSQYKYAMGYACPDSGPNYSASCVDSKAGFYKQVTLAAWQFRYYYDHMGEYNYAPGRWNTIQYSPDPNCGTKDVFIQNYATASLYIYTPYVPNTAALNAYPGTASCGAYGNRNFWFMWQEWFGSTYAGVHISSPLRITSKYGDSTFSDIPTTVSFDITNDSGNAIDVGGMAVAVRDSSGGNHDYSLKSMIVPAKSTVTYSDTQTLGSEGVYTFSLANYSNGVWRDDYPTMLNAIEPRSRTLSVWKTPSLTQGVSVQDGPLQTGKTHTITYTVRNNSAATQTIGSLGLAIRGPNGQNYDPAPATPVALGAGQSRVLSYTFKPPMEGTYSVSIAAKLNDWVSDYPVGSGGMLSASAAPRVVVSAPLTATAADPRMDQRIPLKFTIKNNSEDSVDLGKLGLWGRDPQNRNIDPGVVPVTLSPGEERVISFDFKPSTAGNYSFGVLGQQADNWNDGPASPAGYSKSKTVAVKDSVVVSSGVELDSGATAYQGQASTVGFKVKNYGEDSVDLGKLGLWGRDPQNRNIDPGVVPVTLSPGEERVISFDVGFSYTGKYSYGILQTRNNGSTWQDGPVTEGSAKKDLSVQATTGAVIVQGIGSSAQSLHATQSATLSFKVKNQTGISLNLGKLGLWGRDPQNRNIDPGVVPVTLSPGEERVISFDFKPSTAGNYSFGVLGTTDNGATWTGGPNSVPGQSAALQLSVKASTTLLSSIGASPSQVSLGQCQTLSYTIKNYDMINSVDLGKLGLWGRDPQNRNIDPGVVPVTLSPGEERVISAGVCGVLRGTYTYGILQTKDNGKTWMSGPQKELDTLKDQVQATVN